MVEATSVGHDLNRGVSAFTKTVRAEPSPEVGRRRRPTSSSSEAGEPREERAATAA